MLVNAPADIRRSRIGMREDVAGAQQIEDVRHQLGRFDTANVAHDLRTARLLAGKDGAPQRLRAVLGNHVLGHAHLHAEHDVGVLCDRLGRSVDLGEIDVVELRHRERRQTEVGDMHECVEPRARRRHDVAAKGGEVVGAGIAGRDCRRGRLIGQQLVGGNADGRAVRKHMGMQVDQARRNELPAGAQNPVRLVGWNIGFQRLDHAEADADVALGAQVLAGVENLSALDHEIELVIRPHGRERGRARRTGSRQRQAGRRIGKELAARNIEHGVSSTKGFRASWRQPARAFLRGQGELYSAHMAWMGERQRRPRVWWAVRGSNPRHLRCKRSALPLS